MAYSLISLYKELQNVTGNIRKYDEAGLKLEILLLIKFLSIYRHLLGNLEEMTRSRHRNM
jgi:hypothetical protein